MKALARFEQLMELVLEEGFARLLRPQLQPVEMAKRLARAMDAGQTVGTGKIYVPNAFGVRLSPADFARFEPYLGTVQRELAEYVQEVAAERGFSLPARPSVVVRPDPAVPLHTVEVDARLADDVPPPEVDLAALSGATTRLTVDPPVPTAPPRVWLIMTRGEDEARFAVETQPLTLGRGLDNAVVLDDRRVSRHHAQVRPVERGYALVDLGSTNGTFVNGERVVAQHLLAPGDSISLGGVELRFDLEGRS